jgi:hypothetical protein
MNYFIDEEALEVKEKNIFTAIELLTLMPVCGNGGLVKFFQANNWASQYLPHYNDRPREVPGEHRPPWLKRTIERLFDHRLGDRLENYLRGLTDSRWQKKTERGEVNMKGEAMTLQCGQHFSRPNPEIFQQRILNRYHRRVKEVIAERVTPACEKK